MPPPMVVCSICNQQVMKAQTYAVGNGTRACRSHPGVAEKKDELEAKKKADREEEIRRAELREKDKEYPPMKPFCFLCRAEGIRSEEFYAAMLLVPEKERLKGKDGCVWDPATGINVEMAAKIRSALGLAEGEKAAVIQIFTIEKNAPILNKLERNARDAAKIGGAVSLCLKCADKHEMRPTVPAATMKGMMLVYDLVKPAITEAAQKLLDAEGAKN